MLAAFVVVNICLTDFLPLFRIGRRSGAYLHRLITVLRCYDESSNQGAAGSMPQHPASFIKAYWSFDRSGFSAPDFQPKPIESSAHTKIAVTAPAIK